MHCAARSSTLAAHDMDGGEDGERCGERCGERLMDEVRGCRIIRLRLSDSPEISARCSLFSLLFPSSSPWRCSRHLPALLTVEICFALLACLSGGFVAHRTSGRNLVELQPSLACMQSWRLITRTPLWPHVGEAGSIRLHPRGVLHGHRINGGGEKMEAVWIFQVHSPREARGFYHIRPLSHVSN
ncbi:hypothetical protein BGZ61DRAFT_183231 [Ilyonectria robusta]|uniref:uncharacterized protein n=1 Tax=Ilyonectria robusta TaxID=1079257 RepID=UPI001E8CAE02|nr:uncharacterized protein BGZ61DRAFT_183231 [Ilyonectria robusta]KAH8729523.1 hypothetical protein BGZ61DRAFT_183231 [Ilyonectria robusta]